MRTCPTITGVNRYVDGPILTVVATACAHTERKGTDRRDHP